MENKIHSLMAGKNYSLTKNNSTFILKLHTIDGDFVITIPRIIKENTVKLVDIGGVVRPIHSYILIKDGKEIELSFEDFIIAALFKDPNITGVLPGKLPAVSRIYKISKNRDRNYTRYIVNSIQIFINNIINNTLPLHTTPMNSWAINHRVDIIDEEFKKIQDPNAKLSYQVTKADKYFDRGWSAMGLSESVLASRNYLLKEDLRKYTPFGIKHHNPQRNLYQTLGMKGDDLPIIRTKSQQKLLDIGIERRGWTVPTVFLDLPLNFEDQIMIDRDCWKDRTYSLYKMYTVYGNIFIEEGQEVEYGDIIGMCLDNHPVSIDILGEKLKIDKITKKDIAIEGKLHNVYSIKVKVTRNFKEGFKITNLAGNKGICKLIKELGIIKDPVHGNIKAEVVVSLSSVNKRKNFSQICEAVLSRCIDKEPFVIKDDAEFGIEQMRLALKEKGYTSDTPELVEVYIPEFGTFKAIWGNVFWGCIKSPEDQLWLSGETHEKNSKRLRKRGIKFSTVEIRALKTSLGVNSNNTNPVIEEILSWRQGVEYLQTKLMSLKHLKEEVKGFVKIKASSIKAIDIAKGLMIPKENMKGTICDPDFYPDGFILKLPKVVEIEVSNKDDNLSKIKEIFIPKAIVRQYWQHSSGLYSLDDIGKALNFVVYCANERIDRLEVAVNSYFKVLVKSLSTKKGELAQIGMGVRYPHSAKAVATVTDSLAPNTVEIHSTMAVQLGVRTGDVVLVERFPCLGFMSIRPQYVHVTEDEQCKYVIRVSNNSLCSLNLDFDGDVIYIASFKTRKANDCLRRFLIDKERYVNQIITEMNSKKTPSILDGGFDICNVITFPKLIKKEHHTIIKRAVGVKAHTGPIIALCYNLMRLVEGCIPASEAKINADVEVLLDTLGNSVFSQKHGVKSLQEAATNAICMADYNRMVELGFDKNSSIILCNIIKREALKLLQVKDLKAYHCSAKKRGRSNIISTLVRTKHKLYFASRAELLPWDLYNNIKYDANDIPSFLFKPYLLQETEKQQTMQIFNNLVDYINKSMRKEQNLNKNNKQKQAEF